MIDDMAEEVAKGFFKGAARIFFSIIMLQSLGSGQANQLETKDEGLKKGQKNRPISPFSGVAWLNLHFFQYPLEGYKCLNSGLKLRGIIILF